MHNQCQPTRCHASIPHSSLLMCIGRERHPPEPREVNNWLFSLIILDRFGFQKTHPDTAAGVFAKTRATQESGCQRGTRERGAHSARKSSENALLPKSLEWLQHWLENATRTRRLLKFSIQPEPLQSHSQQRGQRTCVLKDALEQVHSMHSSTRTRGKRAHAVQDVHEYQGCPKGAAFACISNVYQVARAQVQQ